jgi:hypothetical protein
MMMSKEETGCPAWQIIMLHFESFATPFPNHFSKDQTRFQYALRTHTRSCAHAQRIAHMMMSKEETGCPAWQIIKLNFESFATPFPNHVSKDQSRFQYA